MQFVVETLRYEQVEEPFIADLCPYHHQADTLRVIEEVLNERHTVCLVNTSVTGSGKTLANFAAAIRRGEGARTIGVYPTNELIADQARSLIGEGLLRVEDVVKVDSVELDHLQQLYQVRSHIEALHRLVGEDMPPVVLTNPDILYLAIYNLFGYGNRVLSYRERVFQEIVANFPILVFDEFHLYNAKQVGNVAFTVGTLARLAPERPHVFIFSSATPHGVESFLERLGLRVCDVTQEPTTCGRVVCEPVTIDLIPCDLHHWQEMETLENVLTDALAFADRTGARGAFIVDSVYDAKRLAQRLIARYGREQVGEVHGYMPREGRVGALERRYSVGTTTIDVGVDLTDNKAKEFLVFVARTGEQFIQRLGRLGRRGREPDAIAVPNRAWVLVPHYVYNILRDEITTEEAASLPRQRFLEQVRCAYTRREDFRRYWWRYAPLEAVAAAQRIRAQYLSDRIDEVTEQLQRTILDLFRQVPPDLPREEVARIAGGILGDQRRLWEDLGESIEREDSDGRVWRDWYLPALERFREGSELQVALYDRLDETAGLPPFKTYNLPFVLRRTEFRCISQERFERLVHEKAPEQAEDILRRVRRAEPLGYLKVERLLEGEPNRFCFQIRESRIDGRFEKIIRLDGFRLRLDAPFSVDALNEVLRQRQFICWISQSDPWALAREQNLPALFEVYPLQPVNVAGQSTVGSQLWSVAFGLNAFMLDAILR
ncbi:MAG: type I-D CRISPR-associated helicase Cas3' [Abditibacteriales bacterium]|nr:type I-D CRISPR-associated helicase Cas3' [Abditibacteriales bacterium]